MNPDERQLISGLFERMRSVGTPDKDRDAETLINQSVRANPEAPYMLVQSVLVQEQALQAANNRVLELEDQLREMQGGADQRSPRSGGFLGGFWGNRGQADQPRAGSVPQIGARATPPAYENRSPWSQGPAQQQPMAQQAAPPASGGFMKSAMATAAGVAGGMLLAESVRNMMGGNSAHASGAQGANAPASSDGGYAEKSGYVDESSNDPGRQDANDPGYDAGDAGGDIEI